MAKKKTGFWNCDFMYEARPYIALLFGLYGVIHIHQSNFVGMLGMVLFGCASTIFSKRRAYRRRLA